MLELALLAHAPKPSLLGSCSLKAKLAWLVLGSAQSLKPGLPGSSPESCPRVTREH